MQVINLFAGPGAGKSTTAAGLFYEMKKLNLNVELVTEYAKEKVWENSLEILNDQLYIAAKQNRRLKRLEGKVDYCITDSPLLLGSYYSKRYGADILEISYFIERLFDSYNNFNIFIKRTKEYKTAGRLGDYESALEADEGVRELLAMRSTVFLIDSEDLVKNIIIDLVKPGEVQRMVNIGRIFAMK